MSHIPRPKAVFALFFCATAWWLSSPASAELLKRSADWINTTGYEDSPYLSPDGKHLYFMYTPWSTWPAFFGQPPVLIGPARPGHHVNPDSNPWEDSDLYLSTRQLDGTWSAPRNMEFNDRQADCCAMTWDGVTFAYQRTQWANSALTDIYFMEAQPGGGWIRTSAGPGVNSPSASESNPHLSADGMTLYFTSNRAGGFGKNDLYVSRRAPDGTWMAAQNLGGRFNTRDHDDQIWVSRNGRTIYFNRDPGPQIVVSEWTRRGWSSPAPVRFGSRFVQGAEASLTDDQSRIVFAEVRPELEDIVIMEAQRRADGSWSDAVPLQLP